ncbi:MAG: glycosyltransferase family 2 protein [Deltaproteobacteria bacterium]|nr:MAG: glycosyltransferase family 2 protein [Deltaproteobacteria bacterium]
MVEQMSCPSIAAVIVTYHPELPLLVDTLKRIEGHLASVLIVDNSVDANVGEKLHQLAEDNPKVHVHLNPENLGLSGGLNQGVAFAQEQGADWLLTLDQDSTPEHDMLDVMLKCYESLPANLQRVVANISPVTIDKNTGHTNRSQNSHLPGASWVWGAITSGSLYPVEVFTTVGRFDPDLFIYHIDTDFSWRINQAGYQTLQVHDAILHHSDGEQSHVACMGFSWVATNHSPLSRYYTFRNGVFLARKCWQQQPGFSLSLARQHLVILTKILALEHNRTAKLKMIGLGLRDGVFQRMGRWRGSG